MSNTVEVTPKSRLKSRTTMGFAAVLIIDSFIDQIDAFAPYLMGHEQLVIAVMSIAGIVLREVTGGPLKSLFGEK